MLDFTLEFVSYPAQPRHTAYLEDVYSVLAQDNFPYETADANVPLPAYPVAAFCSYLLNETYDNDQLIDVRNFQRANAFKAQNE